MPPRLFSHYAGGMVDTGDRRAKRNVVVLVLAQAVLGAQMPMLFTIGGLAGQSLASNVCFATLPITLIVLGSMLAATPVSAIMQKYGRRAGFMVGAFAGALGGAVGAYGLYVASFPIFLLGSLIVGCTLSASGYVLVDYFWCLSAKKAWKNRIKKRQSELEPD